MKIKIHRLKEIIKETSEESSLKTESKISSNPHKDLLLKLLQDEDKEFVVKLISKIRRIQGK